MTSTYDQGHVRQGRYPEKAITNNRLPTEPYVSRLSNHTFPPLSAHGGNVFSSQQHRVPSLRVPHTRTMREVQADPVRRHYISSAPRDVSHSAHRPYLPHSSHSKHPAKPMASNYTNFPYSNLDAPDSTRRTSIKRAPSLSHWHVPRLTGNSNMPHRFPSHRSILTNLNKSLEGFEPLIPETWVTYLSGETGMKSHVAQVHSRDDKEFLQGWRRWAFRWMAPILSFLTLSLSTLYFGIRIKFVLSAQQKANAVFPAAWIFVVIEVSVAIPILLQTMWSLFIMKKRNRPKLRLMGNDVPTIDVFITCCGEDDDLILDTVRAACDLDYPKDRFRVILLDDAKSDVLKTTLTEMGKIYSNVFYRRRAKFPGVPHHFKAGNLNYGLREAHTLPGGSYEFMAALDADMIPEQQWLRAIIPHLILDPKIALACPPQLFYNVPADDPLCQSLDYFVHVSEPVKDAMGVAWCTGSGYIIRKTALEEIGNFPCDSIAEDVATSTLLLGNGWKTAYIHEGLQFGTIPDDYGSHLSQRTRWAIGTLDTALKLRFYLWGQRIRHLTVAQRVSSFIYAFLSLFNIFLMLSILALPVIILMNSPLIIYATNNQLRWLIRVSFALMLSNRISELFLFLPAGYATGQRGSRSQLWMSPYITLTIIRSFVLPTWLGGQTQAFKPTGSIQSALNERDPATRAPMFRRVWTICVNYLAGFHVAYVFLVLIGVVISSYRCLGEYDFDSKAVCLLTHAWWPPVMWITVIAAFWIPFNYACDPPNMLQREELIARDPVTGVARPTSYRKKVAFGAQSYIFELQYWFTTVFSTGVFVASFFY